MKSVYKKKPIETRYKQESSYGVVGNTAGLLEVSMVQGLEGVIECAKDS